MEKKFFNVGLALLAMTSVLTGCRKQAMLDVRLEGLPDGPVYVRYAPVTDLTAEKVDTVQAVDGQFNVVPPMDGQVLEVRIEPVSDMKANRRGRLMVPMSHQIRFWLQPTESVRVRGHYEADWLAYTLHGSRDLEAQAFLREGLRDDLKAYSRLAAHVDSLYGLGVENLDEAYIDSLFGVLNARLGKVYEAEMDYVRTHANHLLAGLYLLEQKDAAAFLEGEALLDSVVRHGMLEERLKETKQYFERRKQLEANAAALVQDALAPDFTLTDIHGKPVKLSDYAKRYVVLDFWGTWCPWCIKGLPEMKRYYEKYSRKVTFIGIACRDRLDKVQDLVKKEKLPWISVMNGEGDNDVSFRYGVSGYPTKVILKPGLKVEKVVLGEDPVFYETLDALMK